MIEQYKNWLKEKARTAKTWAEYTAFMEALRKIEERKMKLSEFLKENNCYDEFVDNFDRKMAELYEWDNTIEHFLVANAFAWRRTIQGHDYWKKIQANASGLKLENDMLWLLDESKEEEKTQSKNNGGLTDYYQIENAPFKIKDFDDFAEWRQLNGNQFNIGKVVWTFNVGRHCGTDYIRDLNKIIHYANRELLRLSRAKEIEQCHKEKER